MNNSSSGDDDRQRDLDPIDDFGDMEDAFDEPDESGEYDDTADAEFDEFGELEEEEVELLDIPADEAPVEDEEFFEEEPFEEEPFEEEPFEEEDDFEDDEEGRGGTEAWDDDAFDEPTVSIGAEGSAARPGTNEDERMEQAPEQNDQQPSPAGGGIPWGLIVVAVVALALLGAGGYGVLSERAATQEEIRRLQAELGKSISKTEAEEMITTLSALKERNSELEANVATLTDANLALDNSVASLETQLASLQEQLNAAKAAKAAAPAPKTSSSPSRAPNVEKVSGWFVNFSTYGRRSDANNWASKLESSYGRVVVIPFEKGGKTLYRVRVVGLADRGEAETTAAELERLYKLPKLWIGEE